MNRFLNLRTLCSVFLLASLTLSMGCGKKDQQPNPTPPPAPQGPIPAPAPQPAPIFNGTNCPLATGNMPFNQSNSAYYGALQSMGYGGSNSNSLTLSFALTQYTDFTAGIQNIVGSGAFNFADLPYLTQGPSNNIPTNVCISSNALNNFAATTGTYNSYDHSLFIVMRGYVQYQYSPINPYTGQPGYGNTAPQNGQDTLEVNIGYSCPAYLVNGRLSGCVDVKIGSGGYGPQLRYMSR